MELKTKIFFLIMVFFQPFYSCKFYSFSGSSIPEGVETFSVQFFENNASVVSPLLSQIFTEKLKSKFNSETNLDVVNESGDMSFSGYISDYLIEPVAVQNNDNAQFNRLTIRVLVKLDCSKAEEIAFEQTFDNSQVFDANVNFSTVESRLNDEITDLLIQQIFNKAAINW